MKPQVHLLTPEERAELLRWLDSWAVQASTVMVERALDELRWEAEFRRLQQIHGRVCA